MLRKFFTIVGGQGVRHGYEGLQLFDNGLAHARRLFALDAGDQCITALAFIDGDQRL